MATLTARLARSGWICLYVAITLDAGGVLLLAEADGLRNPVLVALAVGIFGLELAAFAVALTTVEASIAYALYGLGTAAVATISIVVLGEPANLLKVLALGTVVAGVVVLNTASTTPRTSFPAPRDAGRWRIRHRSSSS